MKKTKLISGLALVGILSLVSAPALAYQFPTNTSEWTDADVESFLFLSQIQKKANLRGSNLCIEISPPVAGGKQEMRIISKYADNGKEGGLFQTAKSEIAKDGVAAEDMKRIQKIVGMASGYQQAIMEYDESTVPTAQDPSLAKQFMSAEVIGYTDGQMVDGIVSGSLSGSGKDYSTNQQLGKQRADYLSSQLKLGDYFGQVNTKSVESEKRLKGTPALRDCATWRTAEVKMMFQTSSKAADKSVWAMATKMAPEKQRLVMQYEASKQMADSLLAVNAKVLKATEGVSETNDLSADYLNYCNAVMTDLKSKDPMDFEGCQLLKSVSFCEYRCPKVGKVHLSVARDSAGSGFDLDISTFPDAGYPKAPGKTQSSTKALKETVSKTSSVMTAFKKLDDARDAARLEQLKKDFPDCAKDATAFKDIQVLADQVQVKAHTCVKPSPNYDVPTGDVCAQAALFRGAAGGLSGRLMKCVNMKRVIGSLYSPESGGECRPGNTFSKITFPHMNVDLGCKACRTGWSTNAGAAAFIERSDRNVTRFGGSHTHPTSTIPTYGSAQSPSIHEISDCSDCLCADKQNKIAKIFRVDGADREKSVIEPSQINKASCYCTLPVLPSCGVSPGGATDDAEFSTLTQQYFYDACAGKFVKTIQAKGADQKGAQITNLLDQFNKGCSTNPGECPPANLGKSIADVNSMFCSTQGYKVPSDDPVRDCKK